MLEQERSLLLEIARCPSVGQGPCALVATAQSRWPRELRQVPEPWTGHLCAPILFISSNPSISEPAGGTEELYPTASFTDDQLVRYFANRFDGDEPFVRDGRYYRQADGQYSKHATRFWCSVRARATELLGRPARAGTDYALTEIVHCKSRDELGVGEAQATCVQRYLAQVLELSEARVWVALGRPAGEAMREELGIKTETFGRVSYAAVARSVCFLSHPNARGYPDPPKTFARFPQDQLTLLRAALRP